MRDAESTVPLSHSPSLDAALQDALDHLARLACAALSTPLALILLPGDERQLSTGAAQLIVADARTAPALRDNPLVAALNIVAYAGVPLLDDDNELLGTLCVADHSPRIWHAGEIALLEQLATCVTDRLASASAGAAGRRDTGSYRRAALERAAAGEGYRLVFDANPEAMWVYDSTTLQFLAVNAAAVRRYGYTRAELLARTIDVLRVPGPVLIGPEPAESPEGRGLAPPAQLRHRRRDGTMLNVEVLTDELEFAGHPACIVLARDVTEQRELAARMRQSQQMEAVGQLAGGVAHDFNNLLTVMLGSADNVLEALPQDHPARGDVHEGRAAVLRAADLTHQLLAFSRRQVLTPRVLQLNDVVTDMSRLLRRLIGADIELRAELAPTLGAVRTDPGQLEQVIVNLAVNARDAMPAGGVITMTTRVITVEPAHRVVGEPREPGRYVALAIRDTGCGMDAETEARMYDPFFTTKPLGKGTGLGLATVQGIVKQSGGHIGVMSAPGHGTTFTVYLPEVSAAVDAVASGRLPARSLDGRETLLLVEDQPEVRAVTARTLRARGYDVLVAANGAEALRLAGGHPAAIHLLVSDVIMPGMGGREVGRRLALLHPETAALFLSGYADATILEDGALEPGVAFLQKPFSGTELARKVRGVLEPAPPSAA